ncbi:DEAD box helicase, putative, partial [Hepatocystis sp. ex Piliocolobus tephrosceles]
PNYREIAELDNEILNELEISKTGKKSSIHCVKKLYSRLNEKNYSNKNVLLDYDDKEFEHYCIPPSIINAYKEEGIYELFKEQAECLKIIFKTEFSNEITENRTENITRIENREKNFKFDFFDTYNYNLDYTNQTDNHLLINNINEHNGYNINYMDKLNYNSGLNNGHDTNYNYNGCDNFLFNIPTGMGKTLIYDVIIIYLILYKGYRVILAQPTVSLIDEKNQYYNKLLGDNTVALNIKKYNRTECNGHSYNLFIDIALCTYEQANNIINVIIKNKLKCNYIYILDEIHLINDINRGFFVETLLTKIIYIQKEMKDIFTIKMYGFSATLSNIDQLGKWLNAKTYVSKRKEQKIKFLYKINNNICKDIHENIVERKINPNSRLDPDGLAYLVSEDLYLNKNILIYCPTKKRTEHVAIFLSKIVPYYLYSWGYKLNKELIKKRIELTKQLELYSFNKTDIIQKLILNGIFYHHSQLAKDEKKIIVNAFKDNIIFCICCTTTLSTGLNFNVHTIILRNIKIGKDYITKEQLTQISGRCGRVRKIYSSVSAGELTNLPNMQTELTNLLNTQTELTNLLNTQTEQTNLLNTQTEQTNLLNTQTELTNLPNIQTELTNLPNTQTELTNLPTYKPN